MPALRLGIYAHPWDLRALQPYGGLPRLRDLGFVDIALAVGYHAGRWLQPWSPEGRVRYLEDGTVHFRPRGDYGALQPMPSGEVRGGGPTPLEWLCENAPLLGLRARAWLVGTHNSRLGREHPECCVENAFGDRYTYALCPANDAVRHYLEALVADVAAHAGLAAVELEAFGWMGWKHSSHHDKSSFTPKGLLDHALSLCFCAACRRGMAAEGRGVEDDPSTAADPERSRKWARDLVDASVRDADAMAPPAVADDVDVARWEAGDAAMRAAEAALWPARSMRVSALAAQARRWRAVAPATVALAVQVHPHPLFTGSQMQVRQTQGFARDAERVVTCYGEGPAAIAALLRQPQMELVAGSPRRLCIWPKAPQFARDDDLHAVAALCREHGIEAISIYHLGLLPWRTIERAARILSA